MSTKEEIRHFIENAPDSVLDLKLILLVGVCTGLRCDIIAQLEWRHIRLNGPRVEIFSDYEIKTYQRATETWFSFPWRANNPALDPLLLFIKYSDNITKKDDNMLNGRAWFKILQDKTSGNKEKITQQVRGRECIGTVPRCVAE